MDWITADRTYVWHPFTQTKTASAPLAITRGCGPRLYQEDGTSLIDAISSWWCNLHGHSHPHIVKAIAEQAATLDHVLFGGATHPQAVRLAERLLQLLPYDKVFYSDNGSTAVETALKMALQYRYLQGHKATKIMALKGGYHGDTFGAMAAGRSPFHEPFLEYLFEVTFIDPPYAGQKVDLEDVGLFIFEPLIQGAGGFHIHDLRALDQLIKQCRERGILTIADEVMTGFGRTGSLFAVDGLQNKPDFVCLSKGITGGVLPLAATLTHNKIFDAFTSDLVSHAFLHGHTYTANPIACAAANASLDLLLDPDCVKRLYKIKSCFEKLANHVRPRVKRATALGAIFIMEFAAEGGYFSPLKESITAFFLEKGILVRPLGNTLYLMPPYCLSDEELDYLYTTVVESLDHVHVLQKRAARDLASSCTAAYNAC